MSMRPPASRRVRTPAIALALLVIVQSGPGGLWILSWRGKRARYARCRLTPCRRRVSHNTLDAADGAHRLHRHFRRTLDQDVKIGSRRPVTLRHRKEGTDRASSLRSDERSRSPESAFTFAEIGVHVQRNTHHFSNIRRFFGGQFSVSPGGQFRMSLDSGAGLHLAHVRDSDALRRPAVLAEVAIPAPARQQARTRTARRLPVSVNRTDVHETPAAEERGRALAPDRPQSSRRDARDSAARRNLAHGRGDDTGRGMETPRQHRPRPRTRERPQKRNTRCPVLRRPAVEPRAGSGRHPKGRISPKTATRRRATESRRWTQRGNDAKYVGNPLFINSLRATPQKRGYPAEARRPWGGRALAPRQDFGQYYDIGARSADRDRAGATTTFRNQSRDRWSSNPSWSTGDAKPSTL